MKKNKLLIVIFAIAIIIVITAMAVITMNQKIKQEENFENTDVELRILINSFLQKNPYISSMSNFEEGLISYTDIVKSAIYSEDVELNYIVTEEIEGNEILSCFEGYKKSIKDISQYAKEVFMGENLELNFVETYFNDSGYLLLNEEYIYFSKQEYPEKVYVTVGQEQKDDLLKILIYEYTVDENKETLENMVQTGIIDKSISTSNEFILEIKIENEKITVIAKY